MAEEKMIKKYSRKPPTIEAMQWDATKPYESFHQLTKWIGNSAGFYLDGLERGESPTGWLVLGQYYVEHNDYVLKDSRGDVTACKPKQFLEHYEEFKETT